MDFQSVDPESCQHTTAIELSNELREHINDLLASQTLRNQEVGGGLCNVVLAGLTIAWLDTVYSHWNTVSGESAMSLLKALRPQDKEVARSMRRAARDFLRRSGWWIRGTK